MLHAARWKYRMQKIAENSPSWHHRTTLSACIFATKACIDNRKNLLNINVSSIYRYNMVNFGPLPAEICWRVWGTPAISTAFACCLCYCCDVAQRRPSKLCTMFGVSWAGTLQGGPDKVVREPKLIFRLNPVFSDIVFSGWIMVV